ncbi:MAG: hypothetical protein RR768_02155 [Clostridium sp.]
MIKKVIFSALLLSLMSVTAVFAEPYTVDGTSSVEDHLIQGYDTDKRMYTQTVSNGKRFYSNIPNGMVTNRGVVMELETGDFFYTLTRDNLPVDYISERVITDSGYYHLNVIAFPEIAEGDIPEPTMEELYSNQSMPTFELYEDAAVYSADFYFTISQTAENRMDFINAPEGYHIRYLEKDGVKVNPDAERWHRLTEDGTYHFLWQPEKAEMPSCETVIARDTTPPLLIIRGVGHDGTAAHGVTMHSEEPGVVVTVSNGASNWKLEGEQIENERIRQPGIYSITTEDQVGNRSRYTMVVQQDMTLPIIFTVIFFLAAGFAGFGYIRYTGKRFQVR